jgi:hypothetical protein
MWQIVVRRRYDLQDSLLAWESSQAQAQAQGQRATLVVPASYRITPL